MQLIDISPWQAKYENKYAQYDMVTQCGSGSQFKSDLRRTHTRL
jgi:hypothetical protein